MNILEIAEQYQLGNIAFVKRCVKIMNKYDFLQFIFRLQDLGIKDSKIEKLIEF